MTTDTTSVDALRTRLARAFEVAALRDPSAELAAFEAAVRADERREASDTVAVGSEEAVGDFLDEHLPESCRADIQAVVTRMFDSGILLDAAAVQHEHGERIAKLAEGQARLCARKAGEAADGGNDVAQDRWMHRQQAHETDAHIARIARDLSPPPLDAGCRRAQLWPRKRRRPDRPN